MHAQATRLERCYKRETNEKDTNNVAMPLFNYTCADHQAALFGRLGTFHRGREGKKLSIQGQKDLTVHRKVYTRI